LQKNYLPKTRHRSTNLLRWHRR